MDFYNLDAIISVGYRVNSVRATQFRQWATRLDVFLNFTELEILQDSGKVRMEAAKHHAGSEFEKYRPVQDRLFESDFDKSVKALLDGKKSK